MLKGDVFFLIFLENAEALSNISIKMESSDLEEETEVDDFEASWKVFPPLIPTIEKRVSSPVIVSALPDEFNYKFTFLNKGTHSIATSVGINHQ